MELPRLAVRRPITTAMILISVLVVGGIALARLPLAYLPEVDIPFVGVQIAYPNSNPSQIEKEIVKPVEEVLATLPAVKTLNSRADADQAQFFLEFDWGEDLDVVRMQVSEKMDQIKPELPAGIGDVVIFSFNTNDIPVVQARVSARGVDLSDSYELIEARILNRLRRIPGVARVTLDGVAPKEIDVDLVLDRVREHNVDVGALIRRLQASSSNLVLGQVEEGGMRFTARAVGRFESVEEIGELQIDERGLTLADIAEITYEEPPAPWGRHLNMDFAVGLEVFKESTANTVDVVEGVMTTIEEEINSDPLLEGVTLFVWENQADEITGGLNGLLKAGTIGALLAVLSLYFFLRRFDSTFIVSLSIPFSILAACGILYFLGASLNVLSMMGLMLAVGMLVDNAVVVLESIDRTHRVEPDPRRSALLGAREVSTAVAASTLTTLIVFLPLVVGGKTSLVTWLSEIGVTITIALACSLFSSLTLIPLVSAHFLGRKKPKPVQSIAWLEERYARTLRWTLRHPVKTFGLVVFAGVVGLAPFFAGMVESAIFSGVVNKRLVLRYEFADHTYKSEAEEVVDLIEPHLWQNRERFQIESLYSFFMENRAETTMVLARQDLTDEEMRELRAEVRDSLPEVAGVRFLFDDDEDQGGSTTYFAVKLFGQDTGVLEELAEETARRVETVAGVQDVRTSLRDSQREVQARIDRDRARRAGLTAQDMADIFSFTLGAMRLPRFSTGEREVESWLALRLEDRENLDDLKRLQVGGAADGRPILLGEVAEFRVVPRPREIVRENRKVRVSVDATYEGEKWSDAQREITALMDAFELPPGTSWSWNDRIVEQQDQDSQMGVNFLLALMLVYLVMASLFESLAQPFAILFSIPFAFCGVAWMLALTGTTFNLMAQIGLLILMGIVVNNGIVLLDHVNQLRRRGLAREEAIVTAGRERLRPILMTAATTIIGLVPLAIRGPAAGGIFYYPLARTVMGGLISSAFLTLLVLPSISVGVETVAAWFGRVWRASGPKKGAAPAVETAPEAVS
ncbi:MAG: efflux RND transporter permease subunit [Thermoanaerobaculia bacterium]|nr:efflux RND transporter permease subunit [Thermoanaerobaculia bacterium]